MWHERLADQSILHVLQIINKWNIETESVKDCHCDKCSQGKMCKKPFSVSRSELEEHVGLIHADLCGPMEYLTIGKLRYFLLLEDDFSHYKFVYFLTKSQKHSR